MAARRFSGSTNLPGIALNLLVVLSLVLGPVSLHAPKAALADPVSPVVSAAPAMDAAAFPLWADAPLLTTTPAATVAPTALPTVVTPTAVMTTTTTAT